MNPTPRPTPHPRPPRALLVLGAALAPGAALRAQDAGTPRLLLDLSLSARPVRLTGITQETVSYTTPSGVLRTEPRSQAAAVLPAEGTAFPTPFPRLHLADGQCFPGELLPAPADAESMRWRSPLFGDLTIPLDLVRRVVLGPEPASRAPRPGDAILLANGDVLEGFVEEVGEVVRFDAGGSALEIDASNIRAIVIDNPATRPEGPLAWLADGTVAAAASLRPRRDGSVTLELAGLGHEGEPTLNPVGPRSADVPLADVWAVAFDPAHLVPLASLTPVAQEPVGQRRWTPPAEAGDPERLVLGAAPLTLPGPMSVTWTLPPRAVRLGAVASLPVSCRTWGDCELVISASLPGGEPVELFRRRFTGADPTAEVSLPLPGAPQGARLTATLESGQFGPAQDRLVLERALVLLAPEGP